MHGTSVPKKFNVNHFNSLHFKTKSLHIYHISSLHNTTLHITYLNSTPTPIPLLVITFLTLVLNVFILQRKDASKPAANWFQLLMVICTKEYYGRISFYFFEVLVYYISFSFYCNRLTFQATT